jgi:glycosyltransferase involved in cell wall biosynthesis
VAEEILKERVRELIEALGPVEVLVGIPTYNNALTAGHVVMAAEAGLATYFPERKALIVNCDGGSKDGTPEVVERARSDAGSLMAVRYPLDPVHHLMTPYYGLPGRASAFRTLFRIAEVAQARALAVVDAELRSITPEWFNALLEPILSHEFDYVAPYYRHHKYDGAITSAIIYPLTRALFGRRVRHPIGGEFGISGRLAGHFLKQHVWGTDVAHYGFDIWMATVAVAENFKVCQSRLGAKVHESRDAGPDLSDMLVQTVGSVFSLMEHYDSVWRNILGSLPAPLLGEPLGARSEAVSINVPRAWSSFQQGVRDLLPVYKQLFASQQVRDLEYCAAQPFDKFNLSDELWVGLVFDSALAYHRRVIDREHVLKSLTPLYLGWVASFARQTENDTDAQVDDRIERLCLFYEQLKQYLINQWSMKGYEKR